MKPLHAINTQQALEISLALVMAWLRRSDNNRGRDGIWFKIMNKKLFFVWAHNEIAPNPDAVFWSEIRPDYIRYYENEAVSAGYSISNFNPRYLLKVI